jgi:hypothetical protein
VLAELKVAGTVLSLIKGHSGFTGKEMAELYAKKAVKEGLITHITTRRDHKKQETKKS